MLSREKRGAILQLKEEGHGIRQISRLLGVSRNSVKKVIALKVADVPQIIRDQFLDEYRLKLEKLHRSCKGNLVRVCEELNSLFSKQGKPHRIQYSTLTAYCRRHNIGTAKKQKSSGEYHFSPGEEMQHDTSPHKVIVGGRERKLQCASLVLCFSRMTYFQVYETFNRFMAKVFLTDGIKYFDGSAKRCMIDNTHVIVSSGSGRKAVMAPEMVAFGKRFGTTFEAHAIGDANRSARVERSFRYIENNFYPGRTFRDLDDLNAQAIAWCNEKNKMHRSRLKASPVALFQTENIYLQPLPPFIPEVEAIHHRSVNLDGYVSVHSNSYSAPDDYIGKDVVVRETKGKIELFYGHELIGEHKRREHGAGEKTRLPQHRRVKARSGKNGRELQKEEGCLKKVGPILGQYIDALKNKFRNRSARQVKRLHNLYLEYPTDAFIAGVERACKYGQTDIAVLETIILKNIAGDIFNLLSSDKVDNNDR